MADLESNEPLNAAESLAPIPTPMKLQIRRVRYQVFPVVIFTICLALTAYLWKNYQGAAHGTGEVSAVTVRIMAAHDGKLVEGPALYDHVDARRPIARFDVTALMDQQDKVQETLSRLQRELDTAKKQVEDATKAGADKAKLEPLKAQVTLLNAQLSEQRSDFNDLEKKIKAATIEAPVSGTVTSIKSHANELVKQGQEIMTITQDSGAYIVSYVRQGSAIVPKKDMKVVIRSQDNRKSAVSRVQEVGTQIEPIPEHQLFNAKRQEWGIPVRIAMPNDSLLPLRPGELVMVSYDREVK